MKNVIKTYFGADTASAIFSLLIFLCTSILFVAHLIVGAGMFASVAEFVFCYIAWLLMCAVYEENRNDLKGKK